MVYRFCDNKQSDYSQNFLMTHIYIGYLFLAFFVWVFAKKVHRNIGYRYRCGHCGEKIKEKGAEIMYEAICKLAAE